MLTLWDSWTGLFFAYNFAKLQFLHQQEATRVSITFKRLIIEEIIQQCHKKNYPPLCSIWSIVELNVILKYFIHWLAITDNQNNSNAIILSLKLCKSHYSL